MGEKYTIYEFTENIINRKFCHRCLSNKGLLQFYGNGIRDSEENIRRNTWLPTYDGDELPYEKDVVVNQWFNGLVHSSQEAALEELREWLVELASDTDKGIIVAKFESSELRGFRWNQRHGIDE